MSRESGQVAGVEVLPFGVLVFIAATLLFTWAWRVVDDRSAAGAIASEYLRTYTEEESHPEALAAARAAALRVAEGRGIDAGSLGLTEPEVFGPCQVAEVTVSVEVPAVDLPVLGRIGSSVVSATRRERLDAFHTGDGSIVDTPCDV